MKYQTLANFTSKAKSIRSKTNHIMTVSYFSLSFQVALVETLKAIAQSGPDLC